MSAAGRGTQGCRGMQQPEPGGEPTDRGRSAEGLQPGSGTSACMAGQPLAALRAIPGCMHAAAPTEKAAPEADPASTLQPQAGGTHLSGRSSPGCSAGKGSGYGWILLTGAAAAPEAAAARASRPRRRRGWAAASGAERCAAERAAVAGQHAAIGAAEATAMVCGLIRAGARRGWGLRAPGGVGKASQVGVPVPALGRCFRFQQRRSLLGHVAMGLARRREPRDSLHAVLSMPHAGAGRGPRGPPSAPPGLSGCSVTAQPFVGAAMAPAKEVAQGIGAHGRSKSYHRR